MIPYFFFDQVRLANLVLKDPEEEEDHLDQLDLLENKVHLDHKAALDLEDHLDPEEKEDRRVNKVNLVIKVYKDSR